MSASFGGGGDIFSLDAFFTLLLTFWPLTLIFLIIIGIYSYKISPKLLIVEIVSLISGYIINILYINYMKDKKAKEDQLYKQEYEKKQAKELDEISNLSCEDIQKRYNITSDDRYHILARLPYDSLVRETLINKCFPSVLINPNLIPGESCNSLQQKYNIVPGTSWGLATDKEQYTWKKGYCDAIPTNTNIIT